MQTLTGRSGHAAGQRLQLLVRIRDTVAAHHRLHGLGQYFPVGVKVGCDPRFVDRVERHGWLAVGRGLALRPRHHLNILSWLDAIDPEFADLWVKFCYGGMYSRGVVDDKTRLLCMIGDCLAVGEETNARGHMRGALRNGASPREVLEVIFQTCVNFGMPPMLAALEVFVEIMAEDNRLEEIGNPPVRVETFGK